ncbi:MAG: nucleotide exchange factor GrpE [Epsilonproteobacteria bacterium]|nr:MAG: nucleotide exchange factor GrpE [Campylobacterota bacterium]
MSDKEKEELQTELEAAEEMIEEIVEEEAEEVGNEIDNLQAEVIALNDKYARVHADFDNIKKRLEREKYQALEYAQEKFAKDLIPVVDALGMAIAAADAEAEAEELLAKLKEGVELTMKQFLTTLEKHGVVEVSEDEPFDPNVHHAVQKVDSDEHESGAIVNTFQKGYKYKERTLRDAMVVIAN